jgi:hypothetical protein
MKVFLFLAIKLPCGSFYDIQVFAKLVVNSEKMLFLAEKMPLRNLGRTAVVLVPTD